MEIQLGVIGIWVHTQAMPLGNDNDVSAVDEKEDGPQDATLWHSTRQRLSDQFETGLMTFQRHWRTVYGHVEMTQAKTLDNSKVLLVI